MYRQQQNKSEGDYKEHPSIIGQLLMKLPVAITTVWAHDKNIFLDHTNEGLIIINAPQLCMYPHHWHTITNAKTANANPKS